MGVDYTLLLRPCFWSGVKGSVWGTMAEKVCRIVFTVTPCFVLGFFFFIVSPQPVPASLSF